jgi:predicted anti-sigma-YlaC factor YlaD
MTSMDCRRAEELLSDHSEGQLHPVLRADVDAHLRSCDSCRELRSALEEVVASLRALPEVDAPQGLAQRAAVAALRAPRPQVRPALVVPSWVQAAAAGFAMISLGTMLMVVGPERPTRAAQKLVGHTVTAGSSLMQQKNRLVDDVRLLGVVLSTALEGRLDRVNERVEDYRRLLERRRAEPADGGSKSGTRTEPAPAVAAGFRTRGRRFA